MPQTRKNKLQGSFSTLVGSRRQVWNGTAFKTSGGLTKSKLTMTKNGRIVSSSKHRSAKKNNNLLKHGYGYEKGKFGSVTCRIKKSKKRASRISQKDLIPI